jgi:hypothetical protein
LSILSSIIPEILTYPPRGNQPIPYSVSPIFFFRREYLTKKQIEFFDLF